MRRLRLRHGQSTLEYAVLTAVVALSMSLFVQFIRSATAHRMKTGADTFGHGLLYNP